VATRTKSGELKLGRRGKRFPSPLAKPENGSLQEKLETAAGTITAAPKSLKALTDWSRREEIQSEMNRPKVQEHAQAAVGEITGLAGKASGKGRDLRDQLEAATKEL